jgi:hypothetical protein
MRRFISILSAAALVSSVVVVPITASAEGETVLYSDSFDGYTTSAKSSDTTVFAVVSGTDYDSVAGDDSWQWIFNSPASQTLDQITVGFDGTRGDDTAAIMIKEKESASDKYLSLPQNRFQSRCKPQISGFDNYTAKDGEDLVIAFDLKLSSGLDGSAAEPILDIDNIGTITTANAAADTWVPVKIVTSNGATTVYVDGQATGDAVTGTVSVIKPEPFEADTKVSGNADDYARVDIDNLVIMSAANGAEAAVPSAETHIPAVATAPPEAADITSTTTFDFETDETSLTPTIGRDITTDVVTDDNGNGTKVLSIAGTSSNSSRFGNATIDISEYTSGKSHVIVDFDSYISSDGRMTFVLSDGEATEYSERGLFWQGIAGSSATNTVTNTWVHVNVDVNLATGTGTYLVTNGETKVSSGNISTDKQELTKILFISWSPNTSYIDNIVIQAGGELEVVTPSPIPTEEPSSVEGSGLNLVPESAAETISDTFGDAEGEQSKVVNHSSAKAIAAATNINAYSSSARGYSIYAIYDIYVPVNETVEVKPYGNEGKSEASTLQFVSDAIGNITVKAVTGSSSSSTASETLVHDTWYRVLMEVPQSGSADEGTTTGNLTYTVYNINSADPTEVTSVAAQLTDLSSRGLATKGVTTFGISGTGYTDNGATFRAASGLDLLGGDVEPTPTEPADTTATPEPAGSAEGSGIDLAEGARATIAPFDAVEGDAEANLNHSLAKPAVAGTVDAYSNVGSGNAVYVAYDVLVNAGDKLTIEADGNNKVGPQFSITGNADGTASASYEVNKGEVAISGNLVCGTWYRVVIEMPKTSGGIDDSTYTIYRIDGTNPTNTSGIAAQATGIGARNLSGSNLTTLTVSVTGTPYIDNGVTYVNKSSANTWYRYFFTKGADGVKTVTSIESIDDPASKSDKLGKEYYIWNKLMTPYVPTTTEDSAE